MTESASSAYGYMSRVGNGYELRDQSSTILFLPHGEKHAGPSKWIILGDWLHGNCKLMNWRYLDHWTFSAPHSLCTDGPGDAEQDRRRGGRQRGDKGKSSQ